MKSSIEKTLILAAMAIAVAAVSSIQTWEPARAKSKSTRHTQNAGTARTATPADFVRKRSALLERLLVAKRFGIEREDFEKKLADIDAQYTKSSDLTEASSKLQSLADDLESKIAEKLSQRDRSNTSENTAPPLDWTSYAKDLSRRIPCSWYPPKCCSKKPSSVSFELHPDGSVSNLKLLEPTGNKEMDLSVERAVKNASPFAKFSSEKQFEKVIFHFAIGRPSKAELVQ